MKKITVLLFSIIVAAVVLNFVSCDGCKEDPKDSCFTPDEASVTIEKVSTSNADTCELNDSYPCSIYCQKVPCKIEIKGTSQGLVGKGCVYAYPWVKALDGNNMYLKGEQLNINGDWAGDISLGGSSGPALGDRFEIIVTVSQNPVSATQVATIDEIGADVKSNVIRVEETGCFAPGQVKDFRVTTVDGEMVINNKVDSIDCSSIAVGNPCRPIVEGVSQGLYEQSQCEDLILISLIQPIGSGSDWLYKQGVTDIVDSEGNWTLDVQLGDVNYDPRGERFIIKVYATTIKFDTLSESFKISLINNYLPPSNSYPIANDILVSVKHP